MLHWIQSGCRYSGQLLAQTVSFLHKHPLPPAIVNNQPRHARRQFRLGLSILLFLLSSSATLLAWPLLAAIELNYFDIFVAADTITLEWSTAGEYNTAGFEVYCKAEDEPDSAFHLIDQRIAQGSASQGAIYRLDLTRDLVPGQSYCFRLREITTDNTIGEVLQRCGYGLNITPTPQMTPTSFGAPPITTTIDFPTTTLTNTTGITVTNIVTGDPFSANNEPGTFTQLAPFELTATSDALLALPVFTPTPLGLISPLNTPEPFIPPPLPTVALTVTPGSGLTAPTTFTSTQDLSAAQNFTATQNNPPISALPPAAPLTVAQPDAAIANPPYIVLTAPPALAAAPLLPTFTPYPTAVAPAAGQLIAASLPNTQNLMMLLLCGVFSGASGLGILGLITTLLYMRSRSNQQSRQR